jgi:hypothetical protein
MSLGLREMRDLGGLCKAFSERQRTGNNQSIKVHECHRNKKMSDSDLETLRLAPNYSLKRESLEVETIWRLLGPRDVS